jgi:peptidoglycan-associated lipoprotein
MKKSFVTYILIAITILQFTSCGMSARLRKADKKYEIGEYYDASALYKSIYSNTDPKKKALRAEIAFKLANSYRLINNNLRAETAYSNAIRNGIEDSSAYLFYAEILRKNGKYNEAKVQYQKYLSYSPKDKLWAENGILSCEKIPEWRKQTTRYVIARADVFNSRRGDFSPMFANSEGDVLYFTSSRDNAKGTKNSPITGLRNNDIFFSKINSSGVWESPQAVMGEINTEDDEGACCFSADGKTMYFTRCRSIKGSTLGAEIYTCSRAGGEWSTPQLLILINDSSVTVAHPAISPDNTYLYFVSDLKGGYGGKDLWRVKKTDTSGWGKPENLGAGINTPGDEMFPYIKDDGTLYFSSNGHPGFGGLDIYKATPRNDEKQSWLLENMMSPINSPWDDFGITFSGKKEKGFFSSNRNNPKGYDKIYSFELPILEFMLEGRVMEKDDPIPDANIRIIGDNGTNAKIRVKKDGSFRYKLDKNASYIMLASARGYLNQRNNLSTVGIDKSKTFTINFQLVSINNPVKIENIFFDFGKATLTPQSEEALNGLVNLLKDNPNITIEIGAHTDMIGSDANNLSLSAKRAESVINYLIKSGIESERLSAKGYGKTSPVVVSKELAEKYSFMKENDILNEEFISKLSDSQKEIANQINRRTEFRVLRTTYKMY